jgi:hypothetical protein
VHKPILIVIQRTSETRPPLRLPAPHFCLEGPLHPFACLFPHRALLPLLNLMACYFSPYKGFIRFWSQATRRSQKPLADPGLAS